MELKGQDKEIGMPSTVGYNSPNRESSSSKLTSSSSLGLGERIRDQIGHGTPIFNPPHHETLDQHHNTLSFESHFQPLNIPQHQQKSRRDQQDHQNPDPVPAPISTSSATTIITASGSNFKTPPPPQPTPSPSTAAAVAASLVRYRECLKNHAATTGGHVLDGCGEFMPSGDEGSSDSFKCAACECHRNFHRKEIDGESQYLPNASYYSYNPNKDINGRRSSIATTLPPHPQIHPPPPPPPHHHHQHQHQLHQQQQQRVRHYQFSSQGLSTSPAAAAGGSLMSPMMMAFGGGVGGWTAAESSSEDLNMFESNYGVGGRAGCSAVVQHHHNQASASKKRFRTKFSQPQKEKMMEFAEKLGWRIQKHDEQDVQQFCSEVGVKRKVFKVWMHNNKQTMKKKEV